MRKLKRGHSVRLLHVILNDDKYSVLSHIAESSRKKDRWREYTRYCNTNNRRENYFNAKDRARRLEIFSFCFWRPTEVHTAWQTYSSIHLVLQKNKLCASGLGSSFGPISDPSLSISNLYLSLKGKKTGRWLLSTLNGKKSDSIDENYT